MAWLLPDIAFVSDRPDRTARAPVTVTTTGSRDEAWVVGYTGFQPPHGRILSRPAP